MFAIVLSIVALILAGYSKWLEEQIDDDLHTLKVETKADIDALVSRMRQINTQLDRLEKSKTKS